MTTPQHVPVMMEEVLHYLPVQAGGVVVDMTFGGGGYTAAILERSACQMVALDRDPDAIARGQQLQQKYVSRLKLVHTRFAHLAQALVAAGVATAEEVAAGQVVDGVVFDLGVSSFQLDDASRGFSFMREGPLDMRMARTGPTAADLVAELDEAELADIFWRYGDERKSRQIASAIVEHRKQEPLTTTLQLAELVSRVKPRRHSDRIHPATQVFQALRIAVNEELQEIETALAEAARLIKVGGRVVVVSFHSLEDRIVKQAFKTLAGPRQHVNRYRPETAEPVVGPAYTLPERGVILPTADECAVNPRARSAKLRVLERVA